MENGSKKYYDPVVNKYMNYYDLEQPYITQEYNLYGSSVVYQFNKEVARQNLVMNLTSKNYFTRKFVWKKLFPQKTSIEYISEKICHNLMIKNKK